MIYDRLWASKRLRKCSRDAALAYPWIFLVADDHGRFEFDPRAIWSQCFAAREDVSLDNVTSWLGEYETVGLLLRYHMDGDLAVWYNFIGRRPSERRVSEYPDPAQFIDPAKLARHGRGDGAEKPRQIESRTRARAEPEQETERSRAAVAVIDAYNAAFGTKIGPTPGNVRAAVRALEAGYPLEQMLAVFSAVRERKTPTAIWCAENNREFEYLIRPAYKHNRTQELIQGPLDKIPNELATGRRAS